MAQNSDTAGAGFLLIISVNPLRVFWWNIQMLLNFKINSEFSSEGEEAGEEFGHDEFSQRKNEERFNV